MAATNKEIIEKLECLEAKFESGELEQIHQVVKGPILTSKMTLFFHGILHQSDPLLKFV